MTIRESRARLRAAEKAYNTAKPGRDLTEARHELTCARAEYQAECVALVDQLAEALEPWHLEAGSWADGTEEGWGILTVRDESDVPHDIKHYANIGDLRRLSSIYREICDDA